MKRVGGGRNRTAAQGRRALAKFAVLYRAHSNRDKLVQELSKRNIPFVIRNLPFLAILWCEI